MTSATIYIADDDASVREALAQLFGLTGYTVKVYASGQALLADRRQDFGCIVLDWRLGDLHGDEVLAKLAAQGNTLPVLILTAYGDIPTTVKAMRQGATDFMTKTEPPQKIIARIGELLDDYQKSSKKGIKTCVNLPALALLTARERQVLSLAFQGLDNPAIASDLGLSIRTVEAHRSAITRKLGIESLAQFFRQLALAGQELDLDL